MNLRTIASEQSKQYIIGVITFALLMLIFEIKPAIIAMLAVALLNELVNAIRNRTWMFNSLDIVFTSLGALSAYLISLI
jgi:chromate transport protein ChrA